MGEVSTLQEAAGGSPSGPASPRVLAGDRARLAAGHVRGSLNWLLHAEDRAWTNARFALALAGTDHARRVRRVGLRYYAVAERCTRLELMPKERRGIVIRHEGPPPPRRCIYAFAHTPALWMMLHGVTTSGLPLSPVVADWYWDDPLRDLRTDAVQAAGGEVIDVNAGFASVLRALDAGCQPALAVDIPGGTEARFLGKRALLRSGAARLALAADAAVVPMRGAWRRGRPEVVLGAPITPEGEPDALLRRIVAAVEAPLLRAPEYWMPYECELWPDDCAPYRAAFADPPPAG